MRNGSLMLIPSVKVDTRTLTDEYVPLNPHGFQQACIGLWIINHSAQLIELSLDGITNHMLILPHSAAEAGFLCPVTAGDAVPAFFADTIIYGKGKPGPGTIALCGYYIVQK
jgi:hypothetical protein